MSWNRHALKKASQLWAFPVYMSIVQMALLFRLSQIFQTIIFSFTFLEIFLVDMKKCLKHSFESPFTYFQALETTASPQYKMLLIYWKNWSKPVHKPYGVGNMVILALPRHISTCTPDKELVMHSLPGTFSIACAAMIMGQSAIFIEKYEMCFCSGLNFLHPNSDLLVQYTNCQKQPTKKSPLCIDKKESAHPEFPTSEARAAHKSSIRRKPLLHFQAWRTSIP